MHHRFTRRAAAALHPVLLLAALLLAGLAPTPAAAQVVRPPAVSDTVWSVRLVDGSTVIGRVVAADGERFTLETTGGVRMELTVAQVRSLAPLRGRVMNGEAWPEDPNASRLFFGPTARPVGAGRGYFGVFELVFPYLAYGITENFTIAGGTTVGPTITGDVLYVAPKLSVVHRPDLAIAVGALALALPGDTEEGISGLLYGVASFGEPDASLTAGYGFPFYTASGGNVDVDLGILMLGGETRMGRQTKLLTENYFFPSEGLGILTAGIRFFGERLSADAGVGLGVGSGDTFCCIPLVNFVYSFGSR